MGGGGGYQRDVCIIEQKIAIQSALAHREQNASGLPAHPTKTAHSIVN